MTRPTRIYLSGPMRGVDGAVSKASFTSIYNALKGLDYDCYMPGQQAIADLNDNYTFFLTDMAIIISWADAIVLVSEDWGESLGCQAEVRTAFAIGLQVWLVTSGPRHLTRIHPERDGSIYMSRVSLRLENEDHTQIGKRLS